ncbi:MAG: DivIVA domain-containing protein, partial [Phycisphaerales bacterium]
ALVVAEQLRHEAGQRANSQAEAIIQQARVEADTLLNEARLAEKAVRRDIEATRRQLNAYLAAFHALLDRNMAEVEAAEAQQRNGGHVQPAVDPGATAPRRSVPSPDVLSGQRLPRSRAPGPAPEEQ